MAILVHQGDAVPNAYRERCECAGKSRPDVFAIQDSPVLACLGLQSVRGHASTRVSEGGAFSDVLTLQQLETGCNGDFPRLPEGLRFGGQLVCTCLAWYARRNDGCYTGGFVPLWVRAPLPITQSTVYPRSRPLTWRTWGSWTDRPVGAACRNEASLRLLTFPGCPCRHVA